MDISCQSTANGQLKWIVAAGMVVLITSMTVLGTITNEKGYIRTPAQHGAVNDLMLWREKVMG